MFGRKPQARHSALSNDVSIRASIPRAIQEGLAGVRQLDLTGGPQQQRRADFGLELLDDLCESPLRDMQRVGRAPAVQLLAGCRESVQVTQAHEHSADNPLITLRNE